MSTSIPNTQTAVQLTGPDKLELNAAKPVFRPNDYQILCRVETVGLCFSDLKLLKQFSGHVRKSEVIGGIDLDILKEIPSYVPGEKPTVPGHETVVTAIEVGNKVKDIENGGKYLIQADYRWVKTQTSNGAFGYNFEGALQEYILIDQRVITSPDGESMMIPVSQDAGHLSDSAIALCEPWACVEDAYAVQERSNITANGQLLLLADETVDQDILTAFFGRFGKPGSITTNNTLSSLTRLNLPIRTVSGPQECEDAFFDDVIYFGANPETVEAVFPKIASNGLLNIITGGKKFGREITCAIGRVHYGNIRIIGTVGSDPAESMSNIPQNGEIREGDNINVIGAGGPMGVMHVIRNLCQGVPGVTVYAGDLDDERLASLEKKAAPQAKKNNVGFRIYNSRTASPDVPADYTVLMAPVPQLVSQAVTDSADRAIINIFAGIPANVSGQIDLNAYIQKRLYMIGTSGSTLDDMKTMLSKVEADTLDTNLSVGAICGLEDAIEGIRAVENRSIAGKIIVYPSCKKVPLTTLEELAEKFPKVAAKLDNEVWTREAEQTLIETESDNK